MIIDRDKRVFFYVALVSLLIGSFLASILFNNYWNEIRLVNIAFHSSLEAIGGMAAITMAILLLHFHLRNKRENGEYFLLAMGFFMMGIFDTCHAVSTFGHGFLLMRSFANFFGSIWFLLVCFPRAGTYISQFRWLEWLVPSAAFAGGVLLLQFREFGPQMVTGSQFTPFAILLNLISGFFLIVAAVYFFFEFRRTGKMESYLFTCTFLLLGLSACGFFFSKAWSDEWWIWHLERCLAYVVVLYYMFRMFFKVEKELRQFNELLEQRIAERTEELSIEVAERKRYGVERDKVVVELQEALSQIKNLKGLLPTCASCKRIREDEGTWIEMESYIQNHSEAKFSHGICPQCAKKLYPDLFPEL
jgi:hypothetical protein